MGRHRTVDGTETDVVTIRLPVWAIERCRENARDCGRLPTEYYRDVIISELTNPAIVGYEERGEDSLGE